MTTRALIATDGSELAIGAGRRALALLSEPVDPTVLTVAPPAVAPVGSPVAVPYVPADLDQLQQAALEEARASAERTAAAIGVPDAEVAVTVGDPGSEICRIAERDFDVVVVGSHGSGVVKRVLLGSVSHHVLHHAPCPVFVVRDLDAR